MQQETVVIRRRPRLNTTVADTTLATLERVRLETGLPTVGVATDFVVTDWQRMKNTQPHNEPPAEQQA